MGLPMSNRDSSAVPRFSILVPVYNVGAYLDESVGSILAQSCCDYEVVLVDDGSTDGSSEKCDAYAAERENFTVVHQENAGLLMARRAALACARGCYIVMLDADDALRPDALEVLSTAIDTSGADIIAYDFSRSKDFHVHGPCRLSLAPGCYSGGDYERVKLEVCSGKHNNLWSKCYRREVVDVEADYSAHRGLIHAEDLLQLLPIVDAAHSFCYVDQALYYYRPNPSSSTGSYKPRQLDDLSVALDALLSYAAKWGAECLDVARRGALLQISHLIHILVLSQMDEKRKFSALERIRAYAERVGLFGPWQRTMRADKRVELGALERARYRSLCYIVRAMLLVKRAFDRHAEGRGAKR